MPYNIALFGEARKGDFKTAYFCDSVVQLLDIFGEPPEDSKGLELAIQALLYKRGLIFFRVHEEGFSTQDYVPGLNFLENKEYITNLAALCLPGVGNSQIIEMGTQVCHIHKSFLIFNQKDLYDLLTSYPC
jgi:hypothetical protein